MNGVQYILIRFANIPLFPLMYSVFVLKRKKTTKKLEELRGQIKEERKKEKGVKVFSLCFAILFHIDVRTDVIAM